MIQDKLRDFLLRKFPDGRNASGHKEVRIRCRFCGDSSTDRKATHLYFSLGFEDKPPMYYCFKCGQRGILSPEVLMALIDCSRDGELMLIQTNVNCETTMRNIIQEFGPFSEEEIEFYRRELTAEGRPLKNEFQCNLISYLFLRNFFDTQAVKLINNRDYIILMIAAKRKLRNEGLGSLPYIIGGRVNRFITRKTVNKKILQRMMLSDNYPKVVDKYRNEKIQEQILFKNIAQILASEFKNIDFYNPDLNGITVPCTPEIICEEMLVFTLLI